MTRVCFRRSGGSRKRSFDSAKHAYYGLAIPLQQCAPAIQWGAPIESS
jgi:hypothetical protein